MKKLKLKDRKKIEADLEKKTVKFADERVIFVDTNVLKFVVDVFGTGAPNVLFFLGKKWGLHIAWRVEETEDVKSKKDMMAGFMEYMWNAGFGFLEITKIDDEKSNIVFKTDSCICAELQDPRVCKFVSGLLAGFATYVFGKEMQATDDGCEANGACTINCFPM